MLKKIKRNIFLIYYTIRLICKICKAKFILAFILSIINGILPVSSLLVMQQLLNEIQNKTQSYQYVVYLLILYFGLIISESLLQNLASYNLNNLNNHLVYGINYILMKKCGDLSLEMLERTETYDMINRLEQEIGNKPYQTMQGVLGLYLLDEPSSALDVTAETKIFKSFFEVSKNKIAIYITHRVKIAQDANKIIVLDGGKIVGIGTHAELLKNCSVYQDLYNQENLKNKG